MNDNSKKQRWIVKTIPYDHIYKRPISFGECSVCGQHTRILAKGVSYPSQKICPNCHSIMKGGFDL